jgi:hypothetical protein
MYFHYMYLSGEQLGNTYFRLKVNPPLAPPKIGSSLQVTALSLDAAGETEAEELGLDVMVPLGE